MNRTLRTALLLIAAVSAVVVIGRDRGVDAAPGDTVADLVYGQLNNFNTNTQACAWATTINASSLCGPNGIVVDTAGRLWIADTLNHRVLGYDTPLSNTNAQRVFGQGLSFSTGQCNKGGVSASSLCYPVAVAVDTQGNLYVADNGNHRVLQYDNPVFNDTIADRVFGQFGLFNTNVFNNGGTSANSLWHPSGVATDAAGNVYVTDRQNYRTLQYDTPLSQGTTADRVFGQFGSMTTGILNNGGVSADSLSQPLGVTVDGLGNVYIADEGNHRVLKYDTPLSSNTTADMVFGQLNSFTSNVGNNGGIGAATLLHPNDVDVDLNGNIYISETGNERVLEYDNPVGTDTIADQVFGQGGSFTGFGNNSGGLNASSLADPWSVTIDRNCHLWVADLGNNRALEYDSPPPLCAKPPTFTPTSTICPIAFCTATPTPTDTATPTETPTPTNTPPCSPLPPNPCDTPTPTPTCDPSLPPGCATPTPTCAVGPGGPCTPSPTPTCDPNQPGAQCSTDTPTFTPTLTVTPTPTCLPPPVICGTSTPTPSRTPTSTPPPPLGCAGLPATITGTPGNDILVGTPGNDIIAGGGGNDILYGLTGDDFLCGDAGNDVLFGNKGDDSLFGDLGNDTLFGNQGFDFHDGGPQFDFCNGGQPATGDTQTACESIVNIP